MKIIAFENINELAFNAALKVNKQNDYIMIKSIRFNNGEGKIKLNKKIENEDIYILSDTSNYSIKYKLRGNNHYMSPDEHYQDIIRLISILKEYKNNINIIMPLLYESRQHRIIENESLDSLLVINQLKSMNINNIITYDTHDPNISKQLINIMPTSYIANNINNIDMVIAPDKGATNRAIAYAKLLNCDIGIFCKRRSKETINGKNEILKHEFIGDSVKDKNLLIVDDIIASGDSILDTCYILKKLGANNIQFAITFSLFTSGIDKFIQYYKNGLFNKIYTTNLNYIDNNIKNLPFINITDMSEDLGKRMIL